MRWLFLWGASLEDQPLYARPGIHIEVQYEFEFPRYGLQADAERAGRTPLCQSVGTDGQVEFGAVWEGSPEKQAESENAIFGQQTPQARFDATIRNQAVIDKLQPGKKYYVTFTEAPN